MFKRFFSKNIQIPTLRLSGIISAQSGITGSGLAINNLDKLIEKLFSDKKAPAVAIIINSPGGSPTQSSLIAKKINLKIFIYLGSSHKKLDRSSDKITSDTLEAIVGAIYLDGGLKSAEKFIDYFWGEHLLRSNITLIDSKTKLQEFSLKKFKVLPKYIFSKKTGPQHRPMFKTEVQIPNSKKIIGIGSSKKNAQQDAANKLLKLLDI